MIFKVKSYAKENWGYPFLFGFMVLLLGAAISLGLGLSSLAGALAVYAFYSLVAGVGLQLACFFLKCRNRLKVDFAC